MAKRFYGLRNYIGVAAHYGLTAAVGFAAYTYSPLAAIYLAAPIMTALTVGPVLVAKKLFENELQPYGQKHKFSPNIGKIAERLYKAAGIESEKHPIYQFRVKKAQDKSKRSSLVKGFGELMRALGMSPNAMAFGVRQPVVMITEPLLKILNDDEEEAVLAHEFAHVKSKHLFVSLPQGLLGSRLN